MDWTQVWTVLGVTAGLFLASIGTTITMFVWNRTESRNDFRNLQSSLNANLLAIRDEMKDFHGRLCAIEERNRK